MKDKIIPFKKSEMTEIAIIKNEIYVAKKPNENQYQCEQCDIEDEYCHRIKCGIMTYKKINKGGI